MIKIAIIGAGRMGKNHAKDLKKLENVEICGVYDPVDETARAFCKTFGVDRIYASEAEVAGDTDADGVVICNYTDQHFDSMRLQIEAGRKKIFCEKPAVRTLEQGKAILDLARANGVEVLIGHHRRYDPGYVRVKQMVDEGALGAIRMAKVHWCSPAYSRQWDDFFANFERSGGTIVDMMSHMFDQMNWCFGDPESVCGDSVMLDPGMPLPMDYVSGTLTYADGPICNIDCSWQRYGVACDTYEVYGDEACAIYTPGRGKVDVYRKGEHTEISIPAPTPIMHAYVDMLTDGAAPRVALQDGIQSVRVALAMIEAAQSHSVIRFADFIA